MFLRKQLYPLLAATLISAPAVALADPAYTLNFLPDGFSASSLASNGAIAGSIATGTGSAGAIFQGGSLTRYDSLGITEISGLNASGTFTGTLQAPGMTEPHAFVYHDGTLQDLGTDGQQYAYGRLVNASGQMTGEWINGPYGGSFLYSGGTITDLGTLGGGPQTFVNGMNDAGVIVGMSLPLEGTYHAYVYNAGVMTDLGTPYEYESSANGINNSGDIVGSIAGWAVATPSHAFLYNGGVMHDLGTFGGDSSYANGINDGGFLVGSVGNAAGGYGFLYNGGISWDLNALVTGAGGWTIRDARSINDAGQILGWACDSGGACRDVVLDPISCVPEPGTYAMLLAGLAGLVGRQRFGRRRKDA